MGKKPIRYERPRLEVEFDQECLTAGGCCRFVPVVLRFCGVPIHKQVRLEVVVERIRVVKDGIAQHDYAERPTALRLTQPFENYSEGKLDVLARAHTRETGTVQITMSSPSGTVLSLALLRFDSRQDKPIVGNEQGFTSLTFTARLRSDAERESLRGHVPFPAGLSSHLATASAPALSDGMPIESLWE